MQLSHLERPVPSGGEKKLQEKLDSLSIKAALQCNHILLALNKNKEDQKKLHSALNDTLVFTRDCFSRKRSSPMQIDRELFSTLKQEAFDALEEIGQSVWEKVKYLE
ncbi:hypothetical protein CO614_10000 [Lysobacteraceae bacterium NML120232]|nr:hypothetical protein CO614_10000 [Xanthomonadaceae bacterium NML120232]